MHDKNFIDGMRFNPPHEKAPIWIKGQIAIEVEKFIAYAKAHQDNRGWLNVDVKESKNGNLYCELNTYGRAEKVNEEISLEDPLPQEPFPNDDIPF